jgi:hypothetical protein
MLPKKINNCHNEDCKTELNGLKKVAQGMNLCERNEKRKKEKRNLKREQVRDSKLKF